jgi:hypothetical protein
MTDPIDETQPHPSADPASGAPPAAEPGDAAGSSPPLRADPDRPADSGWREPAWFPPKGSGRDRDRRPGAVALVVGLIFIAVGAYYFVDRTLGIALPRIQWSSVWPIGLILIGGLILLRSFQRNG